MGGVEFGLRLCKTGCGEAGKFDLKLSWFVEIIFGKLICDLGIKYGFGYGSEDSIYGPLLCGIILGVWLMWIWHCIY